MAGFRSLCKNKTPPWTLYAQITISVIGVFFVVSVESVTLDFRISHTRQTLIHSVLNKDKKALPALSLDHSFQSISLLKSRYSILCFAIMKAILI